MIGLPVPRRPPATPGPGPRCGACRGARRFPSPGWPTCLGGRSVFFGGWSPGLLVSETGSWPAAVLDECATTSPTGRPATSGRPASRSASARRMTSFTGACTRPCASGSRRDQAGQVTGAIPLGSPDCPCTSTASPPGQEDLIKFEAPLAVQGRAPRVRVLPLQQVQLGAADHEGGPRRGRRSRRRRHEEAVDGRA